MLAGCAECILFTAGVRGPFFWVLRMSGALLLGVCGHAAKFGGKMLPRQGGEHTVLDPWRKFIGPLVDGLIRHTDRGSGCSGRPAEQFNGF